MELTPELLLRHAGAGPRYTSYPTAPIWKSDYPQEDADTALRNVSRPASVYVHIPFCVANCTFCGCNMVVAGIRSPGTRYLDNLERYVASLPLPAEQIEVSRIHLGGGTPTWLTSAELTRLYKILHSRFQPIAGAEISVEAGLFQLGHKHRREVIEDAEDVDDDLQLLTVLGPESLGIPRPALALHDGCRLGGVVHTDFILLQQILDLVGVGPNGWEIGQWQE